MEEEVKPTEQDVETDLNVDGTPKTGEEDQKPADEGGEPQELSAEELQKQLDDEKEQRQKAEGRGAYWEREAKRQQRDKEATPADIEKPPETITRPKPEESQYENFEKFNEALMDWKIEQKEVGREAARSKTDQQERATKFQEKLNEGFKKHEDFKEVALNPDVPINENIVNALFDCDHAADIAYHLGQNPQEARRIASLSPIATAREIGKLEARFSGPPQKTTSKAPDPTKPVGDKDVTIPKKYDDMTEKDAGSFIADRNKTEGVGGL